MSFVSGTNRKWEPEWAFARKPLEGELLSSWLVGNARRHGGQIHTFCMLSLDERYLWSRDVDRYAPAKVIQSAAWLSDITVEHVQSLTLNEDCSRVSDSQVRSFSPPWLLQLGLSHRNQLGHGLQYCPACIRRDQVFKRSWRWGFVLHCEEHPNIQLRDSCPHCDSPVVPHRAPHCDVTRCWACKGDLCSKVTETPPDSADRLQHYLLAVMRNRIVDHEFIYNSEWPVSFPKTQKQSIELFCGVQALFFVLRTKLVKAQLQALGYEIPSTSRKFERMRLTDRRAWLCILADALNDGQHSLARFLDQLDVIQRTFANRSFPLWMLDVIRTLPKGAAPRARRRRLPDLLERVGSLAKVHKRGSTMYRVERATLMLKQIK
jgi:TniQ